MPGAVIPIALFRQEGGTKMFEVYGKKACGFFNKNGKKRLGDVLNEMISALSIPIEMVLFAPELDFCDIDVKAIIKTNKNEFVVEVKKVGAEFEIEIYADDCLVAIFLAVLYPKFLSIIFRSEPRLK